MGPALQADLKDALRFGHPAGQLLGLVERAAHRLFQKDVTAGIEAGRGERKMEMQRNRDHDGGRFEVDEHLPIVGKRPGPAGRHI